MYTQYHFIREKVSNKEVDLKIFRIQDQVVDAFTKTPQVRRLSKNAKMSWCS